MGIGPHSFRLVVALVAILLSSNPPSARADDEGPLDLQPGRPPEEVWRVVEQGFDKDILEATLDHLTDLGWGHTRVQVFATLLQHSVYWGAADLDGDGADEILVWLGIPGWCGSAGCRTPIFAKQKGVWSEVSELWLVQPTLSLCYTRRGPEGYPMIWSSREAVWWTGSRYDGLCYIACDGWGDPYKPTGDEANYSAAKLKVRDELRQRRWCEAGSSN
jgi:hypothetical protein